MIKLYDASWQKTFDALWQNTLPPLARAIASASPDVRLAALRVLAYMPGDVSSANSFAARQTAGQTKKSRSMHSQHFVTRRGQIEAWSLGIFLSDLSSSYSRKTPASRRRSASYGHAAVERRFLPGQRTAEPGSTTAVYLPVTALPAWRLQQQDEEQKQRQSRAGTNPAALTGRACSSLFRPGCCSTH